MTRKEEILKKLNKKKMECRKHIAMQYKRFFELDKDDKKRNQLKNIIPETFRIYEELIIKEAQEKDNMDSE